MICVWKCIEIAPSMILELVGRFDIGLWLAGEVESRLGFMRSGVIWAVLYMLENVLLGRISLYNGQQLLKGVQCSL